MSGGISGFGEFGGITNMHTGNFIELIDRLNKNKDLTRFLGGPVMIKDCPTHVQLKLL